jgi:hypothetical protein
VNYRVIRKILVATVGIAQVMIGFSSIVFIYILNFDLFDFRAAFNISMEEVSLYALLFLVFSLFSLISGFLFIQEWRSLV